jgi:hypothetical protein
MAWARPTRISAHNDPTPADAQLIRVYLRSHARSTLAELRGAFERDAEALLRNRQEIGDAFMYLEKLIEAGLAE